MYEKHFNIPIFIPQVACPHQCVFCNQQKISGAVRMPSEEDVKEIIENHLSTIPDDSYIEVAFFGGNFTGIPHTQQQQFLQIVAPYIEAGRVQGIRISTRPDYINDEITSLLKRFKVTSIELGVQSMDEEVLKQSGRGHTPRDIIEASDKIKQAGFSLGLQMMIGLPGDTIEKSINTANAIVDLGAECTRIYPTIVVKNTELEELFLAKKYSPLSMEDSVSWTAEILRIFEEAGIDVIRIGLHPSEGLLSGDSLVAGPFHTSFRELVLTEIWRTMLEPYLHVKGDEKLTLCVSPYEYNYAIGHKAQNKNMLCGKFKKVIFKKDISLKGREFDADYH